MFVSPHNNTSASDYLDCPGSVYLYSSATAIILPVYARSSRAEGRGQHPPAHARNCRIAFAALTPLCGLRMAVLPATAPVPRLGEILQFKKHTLWMHVGAATAALGMSK